jgi:hypothetical protein
MRPRPGEQSVVFPLSDLDFIFGGRDGVNGIPEQKKNQLNLNRIQAGAYACMRIANSNYIPRIYNPDQ